MRLNLESRFLNIEENLENIIRIGKVIEVNNSKALCRVELDENSVTDWIPILRLANSFVKVWMPIKVNEQVLLISPSGQLELAIVLVSIYSKDFKEPIEATQEKAIIEFQNGPKIIYDNQKKEISIDSNVEINIKCKTANIDSEKIKIGKGSLITKDSGVVTGTNRCLFGNFHHDKSNVVFCESKNEEE